MSLTELSLVVNNLIIPGIPARESLVSDIPAGDRKISNLFNSARTFNLPNI
jgi:hypothetical protein